MFNYMKNEYKLKTKKKFYWLMVPKEMSTSVDCKATFGAIKAGIRWGMKSLILQILIFCRFCHKCINW